MYIFYFFVNHTNEYQLKINLCLLLAAKMIMAEG